MSPRGRSGAKRSVAARAPFAFAFALLAVGCASNTDAEQEDDAVEVALPSGSIEANREKPLAEGCTRTYSAVVPAYVEYRAVHCDGWTGKVFCEYDSLSSVYGPGWGTCQCYNDWCEKRGRSCRVRSGRSSC